MPNMWKIIAFLVFQAPAFVSSHLVLNKVLGLTVSAAMECLSEMDITIYFISKYTSINVTVAACLQSIKSCYFFNQSMGELYSVSFIGGGGQFLILKDNSKTWGQYICCETHNSTSCQSTEISPSIISSTDANTDRNSNNHIGENDSTATISTVAIVAIVTVACIILAIVAIVAIIVAFLAWMNKTRLCCRSCRPNTNPRADNEGEGNPMIKQNDGGAVSHTIHPSDDAEASTTDPTNESGDAATSTTDPTNKSDDAATHMTDVNIRINKMHDNGGEGNLMIKQPTVVQMPPKATSTSVRAEDPYITSGDTYKCQVTSFNKKIPPKRKFEIIEDDEEATSCIVNMSKDSSANLPETLASSQPGVRRLSPSVNVLRTRAEDIPAIDMQGLGIQLTPEKESLNSNSTESTI